MNTLILNPQIHPFTDFKEHAGGKAHNLKLLQDNDIEVPAFMAIGKNFLRDVLQSLNLYPLAFSHQITEEEANKVQEKILSYTFSDMQKELVSLSLQEMLMDNHDLAVRSSGLDEDSKEFSFAGQFESFLFVRGLDNILLSIKKCWSSGFSHRVLSYRQKNGLPMEDIQMGVVLQKMIRSLKAGVTFSRNPIDLVDFKNVVIDGVWGQGEGLVSGAINSDHYLVDRETLKFEITEGKQETYFELDNNNEVSELSLAKEKQEQPLLSEEEIKQLVEQAKKIESIYQLPMDIEWAIEGKDVYFVQARPITNLPTLESYDPFINGMNPTLWDNSNIVESFNGVTTPLTFSFARYAYYMVYKQFCGVAGIPDETITQYDNELKNMLGFIRGRIYYNLINWYKLLYLFPGVANNKSFMETMMGVKEELDEKYHKLFDFVQETPSYTPWRKMKVMSTMVYRFIKIDSIIADFDRDFDAIYDEFKVKDYAHQSPSEIITDFERLKKGMLENWKAPIINDFITMIFFGTLKKFSEKWVKAKEVDSLQNDLLCGQGDIESTMPTKTLMKIAEMIDKGPEDVKEIVLETDPADLHHIFTSDPRFKEVNKKFNYFIEHYGFRCANEQKLEEEDLTDNPYFAFMSIQSYVKTKSYSIEQMEAKEIKIRDGAESIVKKSLWGLRRKIFFWILKQARKGVKNREKLRLSRTRVYGISRKLFLALGEKLVKLDQIEQRDDLFYLTMEEISEFIEGRSINLDLKQMIAIRKSETTTYRETLDPPDRFVTYGLVGSALKNSQILQSADLLKKQKQLFDDPNMMGGISCCPGKVKGIVKVAKNVEDAKGLNGEILVTYRTDPGWVPLYPSCSGLIIEKGSLLSHSAVVAREMGLPTVVGVDGEGINKLETGDLIELDASNGIITILEKNHE